MKSERALAKKRMASAPSSGRFAIVNSSSRSWYHWWTCPLPESLDITLNHRYFIGSNGRLRMYLHEVGGSSRLIFARYGLDATQGVSVTAVQPVSPAEEAGLQPGDVILEAEFDAIDDAADLRKRLGDLESAVLLYSRGDSTVFTTIRRM